MDDKAEGSGGRFAAGRHRGPGRQRLQLLLWMAEGDHSFQQRRPGQCASGQSSSIIPLLETELISQEELNTFLITAVKVWLMRRERFPDETQRPWSEAFQESAVAFVDQLIDENRVLFEELARL